MYKYKYGVEAVPVLTYHSIDDSGSVISTSPEQFRNQIRFLHDSGFHVISLKEACHGNHNERSIVITFDDGFKNFYDKAYPPLADFGFPVTVFVVTGHCGRYNDWPGQPSEMPKLELLDWNQIEQLSQAGVEFGSHSVSHLDLTCLTRDQLSWELTTSKNVIEKHTGKNVSFFCYPYGFQNEAVRDTVSMYYKGGCTTEMDFLSDRDDPYSIPRVDMYYFSNNHFFRALGSRFFYSYVQLRKGLRKLRHVVKV